MDENPLFLRSFSIDWSAIDRDSYLMGLEAIRKLESLTFHRQITIFAGENGSGKSTLLEALAVAWGFNPEGGTRNYAFSTYDSHSELHDALHLVRSPIRPAWGYFLRAESFYNVATMEEEYRAIKSMRYHEKSHGEAFLALVQENFRPEGIYFLDEPEAALSPQRQLTLLMELHRCARGRAQFIMVTHSPILLGMPGAEILSFDEGEIHPIAWEDTESYTVTSLFINSRERLLRRILDE